MRTLVRYPWPGNVRELGNVIERAMILSPSAVLNLDAVFETATTSRTDTGERIEEVERVHFLQVLERCGWRINGAGNAADVLGMHPNTFRSRLKKLGIARPSGAVAPSP
jgi:formate hydrogenlyase transcriptional activator